MHVPYTACPSFDTIRQVINILAGTAAGNANFYLKNQHAIVTVVTIRHTMSCKKCVKIYSFKAILYVRTAFFPLFRYSKLRDF